VKKICFVILFIFFGLSLFYANNKEIINYITSCELLIYLDSFSNSLEIANQLLKRFYGNNYEQMCAQISEQSKITYGVDILNKKYIELIGIDINKPLAYVHIKENSGYLLLPISSKKSIQQFIKNNYGDNLSYKFIGDYLAISENTQNIILNSNLIIENEGFKLAIQKLEFSWNKPFIWIESKYLTDLSSSVGITQNLNVPYGFTAILLNYEKSKIQSKIYVALISENQRNFVLNMKNVNFNEKFNLLDFIEGNPIFVGYLFLNVPLLYKYYMYIDKMDIFGIKNLITELWQNYKINVERDFINNCDGRVKLVVNSFDTIHNKYSIYGSIGIINKDIAKSFIDTTRNIITNKDISLSSFELFTIPFYYYPTSNFTLYYGLVENDFVFSTEKDVLINVVKNIFENKGGSLENLPFYFKKAFENNETGYFATIDINSFFTSFKTDFLINRDIFIGIKNINIYGYPDKDENPYGWNTTIDINFYK